ncbi:hypothetical protein KR200_006508 [Drosophila serrata]|nr:hypothetical protein KR200_006508 [Drosophila serrata]
MAGANGFRRSVNLGAFRAFQAIQMSLNRCSSTFTPCLTFAPGQDGGGEQRVGTIVREHQAKGRLFYGIEILARTRLGPVQLDFNNFLPVLPVFVSVVWHSLRFWDVEPIGQTESLLLCKLLSEKIPAVPHLTCYRLSERRINDFLSLNFKNLLALRGDDVEPNQVFNYAVDLTQFIKCREGDKMSICVAGFPDGYTADQRSPPDMAKNIEILKSKVAAGAECVITQMCYKPEVIVKYVKYCRDEGITIPILIGIMGHDSYSSYKRMRKRGEAELPPELEKELEEIQCRLGTDPSEPSQEIVRFFVRVNVRLISEVLAASDDIWGIVFFTLNRFENVHLMIKELHDLGLFKGP